MTDSGLVTLTVTAVNDALVAQNDSASTDEDTSVVIALLANDNDVEGDPLTISSMQGITNGVVISDGTLITYTPALDFNGQLLFSYTVSDGMLTATAQVSITVLPVNDRPDAREDTAITNEDTPVVVAVLANDRDADDDSLTAMLVTAPTHGLLTLRPNGSFIYTPSANYNGADSLTYKANDGQNDSALVPVTITVQSVNQPPVCSNALPSSNKLWPSNQHFVPIPILAISDPEGSPVIITVTSIYQDEAVDAPGSGNTAPDGKGLNTATAQVRAERIGGGNGRVYLINFSVSDGSSGTCTGSILVGVAHDKKDTPVNDGTIYNSTVVP